MDRRKIFTCLFHLIDLRGVDALEFKISDKAVTVFICMEYFNDSIPVYFKVLLCDLTKSKIDCTKKIQRRTGHITVSC